MTRVRILLYKGPDAWVEKTLASSAVQKGVSLNLGNRGLASIQAIQLPKWLSSFLAWLTSKQPMARIGFVGDLRKGDEKLNVL